ncbi:hypothetical protein [Streptomyces sp. NPDC002205]|uniref:hypothetical protein n=1 Tax=Streptomyces sp. NPDC002205 TaxID=3154411 RepID=UPI0033328D06
MWGAHTPTERTTVLADVVAGYGAGVFSLKTAVRMLQEAGSPIDDVSEDIERIQQRAFDQAARLADATGDNAVVRAYGSSSSASCSASSMASRSWPQGSSESNPR